ncbi:MAG: metal-binding protein [Pyrinomonadaceae bacterium]
MPSGRTHDTITCLLAVPAFAAGYSFSHNVASAAVMGAAFVFGGLMFGPDLDTVSRQYSRWLIVRFLWFPYRKFFKHRSRFSHGLIFGALIRVVYFMGALTLAAFLAVYIYAACSRGKLPALVDYARVWQTAGVFIRERFGEYVLLVVFVGLWLGAASHTFTDLAGSFIKTGRIAKFL